MDNLKMHTPNKADENFKKLAELFPNAVTEAIDENGVVVRAIDKDVLMQEISCTVVEGKDERYQFTWPDKKKSVLLANAPISKTLRPCKSESVGRDGKSGSFDSENLYIEGDNLEVLKLLQETYLGKIKIIYIDPPYNTGHDFVYEDDFAQSVDEYLTHSGQLDEEGNRLVQNTENNGRYHTDWLNMMYPRLKLAKDLLTDDGLIFISINEIEQANLEKICDEIFGMSNHVATFVWKNKYGPGAFTKGVAYLHEYVLCYGKNYPSNVEATLSESEIEKYNKTDEKVAVRGGYITQPLATKSKDDRPNLVYPLLHDGVEIWPDKQWIWEKKRLYDAYNKGEIVINEKNGKYSVRFKQYLRDENGVMRKGKPLSLLTFVFNQDGTKEMEELLGRGIFDFPKPTELIKYFLSLRINETEDSEYTVLDFFSGSSTTAHAVMRQNAEDNGKRKYIMVQVPQLCDDGTVAKKEGYSNICEIAKERIRRAGAKIKEENPLGTQQLDVGFRVLKCDSSNMKDVYYRPDEYEPSLFESLTDNIKEDRTPEDLLFQVMLDLGVLLSSKIEETVISGKKVFQVEDNFLIACFDDQVTEEVITEVAKRKPYYFVMRDSSMANDSVAANFEQIFATYSPDTVRKVL
jgi:adenine-specific DNA-methyltransferase